MTQVKMTSINLQKDSEKHEEKLKKMEVKQEDLTHKVSTLDSKYSEQLAEAKQKGISIITNPELCKKTE